MNIWLVLIVGGLITFGMRFSFIYLFGKFDIPETMRRALHYVPPAVLSAIVLPELLLPEPDRVLDISFGNARLLAGVIAIAVAWYTKNTLLTILAGMIALLVFQFFLAV